MRRAKIGSVIYVNVHELGEPEERCKACDHVIRPATSGEYHLSDAEINSRLKTAKVAPIGLDEANLSEADKSAILEAGIEEIVFQIPRGVHYFTYDTVNVRWFAGILTGFGRDWDRKAWFACKPTEE